MIRLVNRILAATTLVALAACSGGGSSAVPRTGASASGTGRATLTIKRLAPQAALSASKRRAQEFSTGANALVVDAAQNGASVLHQVIDISGAVINNGLNCPGDASGLYMICTGQIRLPAGAVTLSLATNDARDGSGRTLGSATVPVTIVAAQDNPVAVTLDGTPASLRLGVSDPAPPTGSATALAVTTQVYDADGFVFISPQNYAHAVTIADGDTSASTQLYTQAVQNSTQRYNGTPAPAATSAPGKSVTIPDRYTEAYLRYDGTLSTPFTLTATLGSLTAAATVTPSAPATRAAGGAPATYAWPAGTARGYDPVFDASGNLWVTRSGGAISSINATTFQPTATYAIPVAAGTVRSMRTAVLGPDGAIYSTSGTVSSGAATAPWYVTRFDPVAHTFTDFATNGEVFSLVSGPGGIWGVERTLGKLWKLPIASGVPGTPAELALALPPQTDATPALASLPSWVAPSTDGNLWVAEMSGSSINGTWLAKVSPSGTKLSESLVLPSNPAAILYAVGISGDTIWFANAGNGNEFVKVPAGGGAAATYVVPRLYGFDTASILTHYATVDAGGSLWFVSYLDNRIGRVDAQTGRVDFFAGPAGNSTYGITAGGGKVVAGEYAGSTGAPGLYVNTTGP